MGDLRVRTRTCWCLRVPLPLPFCGRTSSCGFYSVAGVPTLLLLADVVKLLTTITDWDFLYVYPPAEWDSKLTAALGPAANRFERSTFNAPATMPSTAAIRPLPSNLVLKKMTTALFKQYSSDAFSRTCCNPQYLVCSRCVACNPRLFIEMF